MSTDCDVGRIGYILLKVYELARDAGNVWGILKSLRGVYEAQ
jgi:hypothetical protein